MPACAVGEGDVVCVEILGDNGVAKKRFCVIVERIPPGVPMAVLLIFGCSRTKRDAIPTRYFRVEEDTDAFDSIGLNNGTTFHIEDTRAFSATSPQLKKIGRCPRMEFLELKALVQTWTIEGHQIQVLPDKAPPEAHAAVAAHLKKVTAVPPTDDPPSDV